jgi:hypothetical protein|tara:strand:- start:5839 stop:6279 length:441 start_codon:yes stop_codon:yes gene_type:complete
MIRKFDRKNKDFWWVVPVEVPNLHRSALVPLACVSDNYMKMRSCVWKIYRRECGREDLSVSAKLLLWAICERYRFETFSSHDAVSYYCKMIGVSRRTAGRAMKELIESEVVWCVLEGVEGRLRVSQASGRKHYLLVGLASEIYRES